MFVLSIYQVLLSVKKGSEQTSQLYNITSKFCLANFRQSIDCGHVLTRLKVELDKDSES